MWRTILSLMIGGTAMFLIGSQITVGQQAPVIKRTDLLKTALPEMEGKDGSLTSRRELQPADTHTRRRGLCM